MEEKFQNINLLEIGSIVPVDTAQIKDKLSPELSEVLKNDPLVTVTDYKMTDGTGIGVVVKLKNGKTTWFFQHEIIAPLIEEAPLKVPSKFLALRLLLKSSTGIAPEMLRASAKVFLKLVTSDVFANKSKGILPLKALRPLKLASKLVIPPMP